MQTIQITTYKKIIKLLAFTCFLPMQTKQAVDYNGNPISKSGTLTITPNTSPAVLASYTQPINYDGMIDNTFFFNPATNGIASAALLQPDGKIVAVGSLDVGAGVFHFQLARYNTSGSIDPTFNFNTATAATGIARAALLQPDGKIIALGDNGGGGGFQFQLVRYTTNGSVDPTFNFNSVTAGKITAALQQPNGKIVAVGQFLPGPLFQLARYNADGSLDPSFIFNTGTAATGTPKAVLLQPDGKIITLGDNGGGPLKFQIARYNSDGSVDPTFAFNTTTAATGGINAALLQPDGKFITIGVSGGNFQIVRYNANGTVDPSFNVTTVIPGTANAAVLQPDGKIIAVGTNAAHFQLIRYNTDGSLDPSFNLNAIPTSQAFAAVLQPDNKIVAVGIDGAGHFQLARYINPFTLASFTASYGAVGLL